MAKYSHAKLMRRSIEQEIRNLRALDLGKIDQAHLTKLLRALLVHGYISRPLYIRKPEGYRVRINETHELFENTKDLWWPPAKCVKQGRCNEPGQPVFYYSDSEDTAVIEKQPNEGDIITVLKIELIDPADLPLVMTLGIHEFTAKTNPRYGGTPPEQDVKQKAFIQKEGLAETNPILHQYVTEEFIKDVPPGREDEYRITSAIARILINEPETVTDDGIVVEGAKIHGISYPSIAANKFGANVALTTESADRLYRPISCEVNRVEKVHDRLHYTLGTLCWSECIGADGTIEWHIPSDHPANRKGRALPQA
jgi:hypothetical protein